MKKLIFILAFTFSTAAVFTSCRDETERAADDIEDAVDDVADDVEDTFDDDAL